MRGHLACLGASSLTDESTSLEAPFVEWTRTDIVERGLELAVPDGHTWACYRAEEPACRTCDPCVFRLQAFQRARAEDPIADAERPNDSD